jgi:hypothetical protein
MSDEYKIESDKPLPGKHFYDRYPFRQMKPGDSFSLSAHPENVRQAMCQFVKRFENTWKFTVRKQGQAWRCWRVK